MLVKVADKAEWQWAYNHTLANAPRERAKRYECFNCVVALEHEVIVAYAFYECCANIYEIHRIWFLPDSSYALETCINLISEEANKKDIREVGTFVAMENNREVQFFKNFKFDCLYYHMHIRTKAWWRKEGGKHV